MAIVNVLETIMEETQPEKESESLAIEADWHYQIENHKLYFIDCFTRDKSHRQTENFSAFSFLRDQYLSSLGETEISSINSQMEDLCNHKARWKTSTIYCCQRNKVKSFTLDIVKAVQEISSSQIIDSVNEAKSLKLYIIKQMNGVGSTNFLQGAKVFTLLISYTTR
jgi:hypothetical protein